MPNVRVEPRAKNAGASRRSDLSETAAHRCERYRRELMLPAVLDKDMNLIVIPLSARVSSVTAPTKLATAAFGRLMARAQLGPVIAHPRTARSMFLTTSPSAPVTDDSLLVRLSVTIGGHIAILPSPADEQAGRRHWAMAPSLAGLPRTEAVLAALVETANSGQRGGGH